MPMVGWASRWRNSPAMEPGNGSVSGLISSTARPTARASPWLTAAAKPTLVALSDTGAIGHSVAESTALTQRLWTTEIGSKTAKHVGVLTRQIALFTQQHDHVA